MKRIIKKIFKYLILAIIVIIVFILIITSQKIIVGSDMIENARVAVLVQQLQQNHVMTEKYNKMGWGISFITFDNKSYWYIGAEDGIQLKEGHGITPTAAYGIDFKLDDGKPLTGKVRYADNLNAIGHVQDDNKCLLNNEYNLINENKDCAITIEVND